MKPQEYFRIRRDRELDAIISRAIERDRIAERLRHGDC